MSQDEKVFSLRIPVELYDRIARIAAADLRSVNAAMLIMLREGTRRAEDAREREDASEKNRSPRLDTAVAV